MEIKENTASRLGGVFAKKPLPEQKASEDFLERADWLKAHVFPDDVYTLDFYQHLFIRDVQFRLAASASSAWISRSTRRSTRTNDGSNEQSGRGARWLLSLARKSLRRRARGGRETRRPVNRCVPSSPSASSARHPRTRALSPTKPLALARRF